MYTKMDSPHKHRHKSSSMSRNSSNNSSLSSLNSVKLNKIHGNKHINTQINTINCNNNSNNSSNTNNNDINKNNSNNNGNNNNKYKDVNLLGNIVKKKRGKRKSFTFKDYSDVKINTEYLTDKDFLKTKEYIIGDKISKTLQGCIYNLFKKSNPKKKLVVKVVKKEYYVQGIGIKNNTRVMVHENIVKETKINQLITKNNCPREFVKFIEFLDYNDKYYLITEHGGKCLFNYTVEQHKKIEKGILSIHEWRHICRKLFKQMAKGLFFLHTKLNICHLDISLENMLIKHNQIKFCDFGLANIFENGVFKYKKYVGKTQYQCPEMRSKKIYDPRSADLWSIGVVLFTLIVGAPPFKVASESDDNFNCIMTGELKYLLYQYKRIKYMSKHAFDLLTKIFKTENERISLSKILEHPYIKLKPKTPKHRTDKSFNKFE